MTLRVRLLSSIILLLAGMFLTPALFAQRFEGTHVALTSPQLSAQFKAYEVWRIDVVQFDAYVKKESGTQGRAALLQLGKHQWRLELVPSGIIGPEYKLQVLSAKGLQTSQPTEVKAYRGTELNGYGHVRLTVDEDFISGFVMEGQKRWYIEPLWYHDFSADRDLFVVYDRDQ
ncbi:MAG TPA: hypothetical protein PK858_00880, partial [Saprospiraceae bacterium]|nr:hypothetical protein [Saprospiraceae bacterium]